MNEEPYDIPKGAGSRAAAFVGADAGTVYMTVALRTRTGINSQTIRLTEESIMNLN